LRSNQKLHYPGRQLIIWHNLDTNNLPHLQTVYEHIDFPEIYETWKNNCSVSNSEMGRIDIWSRENLDQDCVVHSQQFLGTIDMIGFTTAPHLHYEVFVDRDTDEDGKHIFNRDIEAIDPVLSQDIHMLPKR